MIKKLPKSRIEEELTIEWPEWEKHIPAAVAEVGAEFKFPGFRPGKAPRHLVEQKVGKEVILNRAAEKAIGKRYADFITQEKLAVLGSPRIELDKIAENENLVFKVNVAVMPEVKVNEKYKEAVSKINAEYKDKTAAVGDEEIGLELDRLANSRVKLVTVRRPAANNDSVEVDFTVSVDGQVIDGGESKNHPLVIGKGVFIPGFEENLIGMSEGEEKEFTLEFPKDYHKADLSGRPAQFKVKLNLVQERQIPEINDEFAKALGKFNDLAELKKSIRDGMEHENGHKLEEEKHGKYLDAIVKNLEGELPEELIHDELDRMMQEFEGQVRSAGMELDQYLERMKKDRAELRKDWEPQAEKRIKSALALKEIAKAEAVKVETPEIEAEMNKTMQYYKNVKDFEKQVDMQRLYSYVKGTLENDKVFQLLEKL